MSTDWLNEALGKISEDLELEVSGDSISEEDLLLAIAARVAALMDRDAGLLFSYMYRLDVSEERLSGVINTPSDDPIVYRIAELILNRQKARIHTKQQYKSDINLDGWEW